MIRNYWRGFALAAGLLCGALMSLPALADEQVLARDAGVADSFEKLNMEAHYISFDTPKGWDDSFPQEVQIFGRRYGDVTGVKGNIVLWGLAPKLPAGAKPDKDAAPLVILGRAEFDLSSAPETAGWFSVPIDPVKLPKTFVAAVYTFSTDARGLEIGLTTKSRESSHSSAMKPEEAAAGGKGPKMRHDGREWLIRVKVRTSLAAPSHLTSSDLSGAKFSFNDDGSAEGFDTVQKYGMMVRLHADGKRKVKKIYAYCKLSGDWFESSRQAGVWLMDSKWAILDHQLLNYGQFTNEESWGSTDFPNIDVNGDYYLLIEPESRPETSLLIGYDSSTTNKGSLFGTAGAVLSWGCKAPEESANWMIRVEYQ